MKNTLYKYTLIFLIAVAATTVVDAGTIVGVIKATSPNAEGSKGREGGGYGSRRYKFLDKVDYSELRDFVISIDGVSSPVVDGAATPLTSVAQKNGDFVPKTLPIVVGTEVEWPNRDEIFHNVFSMSEIKPFDLGMYKSSESAKRLVFEKTGKIDVFCAIHSQMHCVVLVLPNPWFDLSDRKGRFEIKNVPAGEYKLKAWHERLPTKYIDIVVPEEGSVKIDIEMGFAGLPKI